MSSYEYDNEKSEPENIVRMMAHEYKTAFPDAIVEVYRTDGGYWTWKADGIQMLEIKLDN